MPNDASTWHRSAEWLRPRCAPSSRWSTTPCPRRRAAHGVASTSRWTAGPTTPPWRWSAPATAARAPAGLDDLLPDPRRVAAPADRGAPGRRVLRLGHPRRRPRAAADAAAVGRARGRRPRSRGGPTSSPTPGTTPAGPRSGIGPRLPARGRRPARRRSSTTWTRLGVTGEVSLPADGRPRVRGRRPRGHRVVAPGARRARDRLPRRGARVSSTCSTGERHGGELGPDRPDASCPLSPGGGAGWGHGHICGGPGVYDVRCDRARAAADADVPGSDAAEAGSRGATPASPGPVAPSTARWCGPATAAAARTCAASRPSSTRPGGDALPRTLVDGMPVSRPGRRACCRTASQLSSWGRSASGSHALTVARPATVPSIWHSTPIPPSQTRWISRYVRRQVELHARS